MAITAQTATSRKALVAYSNGTGSTGEVALAVGERLTRSGVTVQVRPFGRVGSLSGYGAIVIGSSVSGGSWESDAVNFVEDRISESQHGPVWLFESDCSAHPDTLMSAGTPTGRKMATELGVPPPSVFGHLSGQPAQADAGGYYGRAGLFGRGPDDERVLSELSASVLARLTTT
jgi:hypothetical protein